MHLKTAQFLLNYAVPSRAAVGHKASWRVPSAAICYPALALDDRTNDWKPSVQHQNLNSKN